MKKIVLLYSPLCEANGSFIENLHSWLDGQPVEIEIHPFHTSPKKYQALISPNENCFINLFYNGKQIDSVPLHPNRLFSALSLEKPPVIENLPQLPDEQSYSEEEIRRELSLGNIQFIPITQSTYRDEMTMCLCNYPMGNPPKAHHGKCIAIKEQVFTAVWQKEKVAGIYARLNNKVIGLLEAFPREVVQKYGFMTGSQGKDENIITVACYEVAFGIPRTILLDTLMAQLLKIQHLFSRKLLEGIGILHCHEGFNPYWVYEKHGFSISEQKTEKTFVLLKPLS